jgi:hypothetical protein
MLGAATEGWLTAVVVDGPWVGGGTPRGAAWPCGCVRMVAAHDMIFACAALAAAGGAWAA